MVRAFPQDAFPDGEMAEWLKAHAWKACILERVSRVRIPVSPPCFQYLRHRHSPFTVHYWITILTTALLASRIDSGIAPP